MPALVARVVLLCLLSSQHAVGFISSDSRVMLLLCQKQSWFQLCSSRWCAGVKRLQKLGMVHSAPGMGALDMNSAEDMVVAHTREVVPGMVICGMEVCPTPPDFSSRLF